jgi:DNA-binding NarL/FixJ family response regulator
VAIRILVVDDSRQIRLSVALILKRNSSFQVIGEARDGVEAIERAMALRPDVVLLDIGMPRLNGIAAAREITQVCPESKIIFLTQEDDSDIRSAALATGAFAYLLKSTASCDLHLAVERAMLHRQQPNACRTLNDKHTQRR